MTKVLIPNPLQSDSEYDRYYHYDIPNLELSDVRDELYALRCLLWWDLPGGHWLRERVRLLGIELSKRRDNK